MFSTLYIIYYKLIYSDLPSLKYKPLANTLRIKLIKVIINYTIEINERTIYELADETKNKIDINTIIKIYENTLKKLNVLLCLNLIFSIVSSE